MSTLNKQEQAPSPRLPLQMDVEFRKNYARQNDQGILKNISLTGAFLETSTQNLFPKDKVILHLTVSGRRRKMHATIVWKNAIGCGVQFHPFNNRDIQLVDDLLYFVESSRENRRDVLDNIFKRVA